MLVLTRKPMESIQISDNIVVTVLAVRGHRVQLGIEAPKRAAIARTEVHQAISGTAPSVAAAAE